MNTSLPSYPHLLDEQVEAGQRGDFERGWEIAQQLKRTSPDCHRSAFNRAWYEMYRGNLLEGLSLLDHGRWLNVFGDQPLPTQKPIYRDQDLKGKHLLICSEGGLGDEIINVRFAKDFAEWGAKVTVTADPNLCSVFARVPGVSAVVAHRAAPDVYHDYWVPGMSAPRILEYTYEKLSGAPYLTVDPEYKNKWQTYFESFPPDQRPRIGLRFYGNPKFENEQRRRFPNQMLIDAVKPFKWVNLQIEETDLPIQNWEDTLAIMSHLDIVITSCTSVAHASAAMGKETWVIVPIQPYYVWALPGEASPWYQSVKLFRQLRDQNWEDVFVNIKNSLKIKYQQKV